MTRNLHPAEAGDDGQIARGSPVGAMQLNRSWIALANIGSMPSSWGGEAAGGLSGLLLGSVSQKAGGACACAVIIVP